MKMPLYEDSIAGLKNILGPIRLVRGEQKADYSLRLRLHSQGHELLMLTIRERTDKIWSACGEVSYLYAPMLIRLNTGGLRYFELRSRYSGSAEERSRIVGREVDDVAVRYSSRGGSIDEFWSLTFSHVTIDGYNMLLTGDKMDYDVWARQEAHHFRLEDPDSVEL